MLKVGITGGIGTGKSTVCRVFNVLGIPTFDADIEAKALYDSNVELQTKVIDRYGEHLYLNGVFQKQELAKIVFNDAQALKDLNAMVHPLVIAQSVEWFNNQSTAYAIKEAALLIESGGHNTVDKLILVQAPLDERLERVQTRDKLSKNEVLKRIKRQMAEDEKALYADYIIKNGDQDSLINQVLEIHSKLKVI